MSDNLLRIFWEQDESLMLDCEGPGEPPGPVAEALSILEMRLLAAGHLPDRRAKNIDLPRRGKNIDPPIRAGEIASWSTQPYNPANEPVGPHGCDPFMCPLCTLSVGASDPDVPPELRVDGGPWHDVVLRWEFTITHLTYFGDKP